MMARKLFGSRLAPPTRAPSTSGWAIRLAMLSGFTLPPYKTRQRSEDSSPNHCFSRWRMWPWASPACAGVALRPVPMAHTGAVQAFLDLPIEHGERFVAVALFLRFADADNRCQARGNHRVHLLVHHGVGLAKQRPAFRVADNHEPRPGVADHAGADFAGKCAVTFPMHVLRADADRTARRRARCGR